MASIPASALWAAIHNCTSSILGYHTPIILSSTHIDVLCTSQKKLALKRFIAGNVLDEDYETGTGILSTNHPTFYVGFFRVTALLHDDDIHTSRRKLHCTMLLTYTRPAGICTHMHMMHARACITASPALPCILI